MFRKIKGLYYRGEMADCAEPAKENLPQPLSNGINQYEMERESSQSKGYLKVLWSKVKNDKKVNPKRRIYSSMDLRAIRPDFGVVMVTDGRSVLRRNSFNDEVPKSRSHHEHVMLENLLGLNLDLNEAASDDPCMADSSNRSEGNKRNERLKGSEGIVQSKESTSHCRLERRDAVAQITPKCKEELVRRLRARALEHSLVGNGLLK